MRMPANGQPSQRTILVVDDEPALLKVISLRLRQAGYEVLTTTSGRDGLQIAEEQQPDLILLDVMMPGLKGRDVCATLKANPKTREIPVIFLTALGYADHVQAGMALGAEDYIVKPFNGELLKQRIRVCLLRHPPKPGRGA